MKLDLPRDLGLNQNLEFRLRNHQIRAIPASPPGACGASYLAEPKVASFCDAVSNRPRSFCMFVALSPIL
jgi:hypothetical protein